MEAVVGGMKKGIGYRVSGIGRKGVGCRVSGIRKKGIGYRVSGVRNPKREPGAVDVFLAVGRKVLGAAGDLGGEPGIFNGCGDGQFKAFLLFVPLDSDFIFCYGPISIADTMNSYFAVVKGQIRLIYIAYGSGLDNTLQVFRFKLAGKIAV